MPKKFCKDKRKLGALILKNKSIIYKDFLLYNGMYAKKSCRYIAEEGGCIEGYGRRFMRREGEECMEK